MPDDINMPDAARLHELLSVGRWYSGLPPELQQRILAGSRIREFSKGEVIALEGAHPAGLSAVLSGEVKLVRQAREGEESLVFICEPGFWFGEYAVLTNGKTLVSAIARTKVRLLVLPKREFDRIVEEEPRHYRHFAALGLEHAATFLKAFTHASSLEPEARLRGQLALLSLLKRSTDEGDVPVELPYSQSELASLVGVSRQTINQLMHELVARGLVEAGFKHIRVLAPTKLLANL